MVEVSQEMPGLDTASAELDRLISAEAATAHSPATDKSTEQSATTTEAQRAAQVESTATDQPKEISQDGTPAKTDDQPKTDQNENDKAKTTPEQQAASEAGKTLSRFAKDQQRREKTWKEINAEKDALRKEQETFKAEREQLTRDREAAKQPQYGPEDYEKAADKFEKDGRLDLAEAARAKAADLRKNPPAAQETARQQQVKFQQEQKQWWDKAAVEFPEVAKAGSPEHQALSSFLKNEPTASQYTKGMYYAARLITAESQVGRLKSDLARVPQLEKDLGAARAKIKELETLTAPNPPSVHVKTGPTAAQGESLESLEETAMSMGPLR